MENLNTLYFLDQHVYVAVVVLYRPYIKLNFVDGGYDGRVVSAENLSNILKRKVGELSYNVNGNMSCACDAVGLFL